ncbi:LOW QUALITY PROTEIN: Cleavage induced Predicted protein [Phytophthora palmivora]|uniref:Uncharacterized protein n=1 Tax=Phytophthora palmivora TaxID=4796 RepID=A0A2P4XEA1_9STRA|nr:LOW QUALITY PROTEIN: Cleavage induced Predicted protein [Phytophthora palmivora]
MEFELQGHALLRTSQGRFRYQQDHKKYYLISYDCFGGKFHPNPVPTRTCRYHTSFYVSLCVPLERHRATWSGSNIERRVSQASEASAKSRLCPTHTKRLDQKHSSNRYLELDIDLLDQIDGVFCSPFGAVSYGDRPLNEDALIIHDRSFPDEASVNASTVPATEIDIVYDGAHAIATQIEEVERRFPGLARMMSGDAVALSGIFQLMLITAANLPGLYPRLGLNDDLRWFLVILSVERFNVIPRARFIRSQPPTAEVLMDASDSGLCVTFNEEERAAIKTDRPSTFGSSIRELMSAVFSALMWELKWASGSNNHDVHVRSSHTDNTSVVSWNNKRSTRNPFTQLLLQILALQEVSYNVYSAAAHTPCSENVMADAGCRIRESRLKVVILSNLPSGWLSSLGAHGSSRRFGRAAPSGSSSGLIPALILPGVALMGIVVPVHAELAMVAPRSNCCIHSLFGMNRRSGNYYGTICAKLCAVCWRHCFECDYDQGVSAQHTLLLRGITDSQPTFSCNNPSRRVYFAGYTHIWTSHELAINCCGYLFIGRKYHPFVLRLSDIRFCSKADQPVKPH